jgi:hypothetical protein
VCCRQHFDELKRNDNLAKKIDERCPDCLCEQASVSVYSPGPVQAQEILIRVVYSPHHVEIDTNRLKPTALDDAANKGLSTDRRAYATFREVQERITKKLNTPNAIEKGHEYKGTVVISCAKARGLTQDGRRLFAVYDTAQEDNRAHADVCQVRLSKVEGARARRRLIETLREQDQPEWLHDAFRE